MGRRTNGKIFMGLVVAAGACVFLGAVGQLCRTDLDPRFFLLGAVTLALSTRPALKIPGRRSSITVSDTLLFLALLLYGPAAATVLAAATSFVESIKINKKWFSTFFNISVVTASIFTTGLALERLFGEAFNPNHWRYQTMAGAAVVMALVHCAINTCLISIGDAWRGDQPVLVTWARYYLWSSPTYFVGAAAAGLLAGIFETYGMFGVALTAPVIVSLYLTYRMYLKNVEVSLQQATQSERHVEELSHYIEGLKQAEEALKKSEKDYRGLFENAHDAILIISPEDQTVLEVNQRACGLYGLSREEFVGSPLGLITRDVARADARIRKVLSRDGNLRFEAAHYRKDGAELYLDIIASAVEYKDRQAVLAINRDITERRALEEQLRQAQKMESIGTLAGGIAHDFNNLMAAVTGYSTMLLADLDEGDPIRDDVEEIRKAANRAATLTQQLLAFSRKQILRPKVLNLNEVVTDIAKLLLRLLGEEVALVTDLDRSLWNVEIDPGQIGQAVINLAVNARDAMPDGGTVTITTANVSLAGALSRHLNIPPGEYVMLTVSDTGVGIDEVTLSRIFEPFFTTKGVGKGTGLGLSMVHGTVKQSGGEIEVRSAPGRGAHFMIYLPRALRDGGEGREVEYEEDLYPRLANTALLVEDDATVRRMAEKMLQRLGFEVLSAEHPEAALLAAARHAGPIRLLLTDLVMPGMNGRELAERLTPERPGMSVLYMSGYTEDEISRRGVTCESMSFIQKPFTSQELARAVSTLLGGAAAGSVSDGFERMRDETLETEHPLPH